MRVIWGKGRGWIFGLGEARYYGWRWMLTAGPLTICLGHVADKAY